MSSAVAVRFVSVLPNMSLSLSVLFALSRYIATVTPAAHGMR